MDSMDIEDYFLVRKKNLTICSKVYYSNVFPNELWLDQVRF